MNVSGKGRRVLEYFEGRSNSAYPDPATGGEPWTIGIGHTGPEVFKGLMWSDELVEATLDEDLDRFEKAVSEMCDGKRKPTHGEFDALVLFAFNLGEAALRNSTLMRKYLAGLAPQNVASEFSRWNRANGKVMLGLVRRRAAERELFLGRTADSAIAVAKLIKAA